MFTIAIIVGLYSYAVFFLGLLHLLYPNNLMIVTAVFFALILLYIVRYSLSFSFPKKKSLYSFETILLFLLLTITVLNFIGALAPELAFDALWYHLTLPKEFLNRNAIEYIPGGLLYYSAMPQLTEMLYIPALAFHGEIAAKLIHLWFGILSCVVIYNITRGLSNTRTALFAVLIFYSNLVVSWESTTAYIDLTRTFYEVLALAAFLRYLQTKSLKYILLLGAMIGFAVTTKLLALGSVMIFILLLFIFRSKLSVFLHHTLLLILLTFFVPLPWFIFSYLTTGNPLHPLFTRIGSAHFNSSLLNPLVFLREIWQMFLYLADPISPLYLILFPAIIVSYRKFSPPLKAITLYSAFAIAIWYITPRTGGGRFILPYLPALSILSALCIFQLKNVSLKKIYMATVVIISILTIVYRGFAVRRYIPVVFGRQSKQEFLCNNLNFNFGDFYDCGGQLQNILKTQDKVLVYGIHNLFYLDVPYVHFSYWNSKDSVDYILTQHTSLPKEYLNRTNFIYTNRKTGVTLYRLRNKNDHNQN